MLMIYCSALVKTNLISLQEQLELSMRNSTGFNPTSQLMTTINEDLEALESIYQCGLSQERISNDVLSLGRIQLGMWFLSSRLFPADNQICCVGPHFNELHRGAYQAEVYDVDVNLQHEAQKVVSIFQNEARMKRIGLNLVIGESINRLGVTTIKTDPVRLGQV